jgi:pilus assembly protein FimV
MDAKLDLARAYIDMGDEEGARPILEDVVTNGDLRQQAEARDLLIHLD